VRILLGALTLVALVFAVAGGATFALEHRLAALAPGGLGFSVLRYNPFTGRVAVSDLRGRDASGHDVFAADAVTATADLTALLAGRVTLRRLQVESPRLRLGASGLRLGLPDAAGRRRFAPPVSIEGLVVTGGVVIVDDAGERGTPLVVRDIDVRLNQLAAAPHGDDDVAFAVEMAVYGTTVQVTGQAVRTRNGVAGYAVHVRARALDVAALLKDFPLGAGALGGGLAFEEGHGDVEGDVLLSEGRVLVSGQARLGSIVARVADARVSPLRAASLVVVVDRFDVGAAAGRVSRLDLGAPSLTLALGEAPGTDVRALLARLAPPEGLVVRRVQVTDGRLTLARADGGITLSRVDVAMQGAETSADAGFKVTAQAVVGRQGRVALTGVLARDLVGIDALVRVAQVDLAGWRPFTTMGPEAGLLGFDGRVRLDGPADDTAARISGRATVDGLRLSTGFRAESVDVRVRRLNWPRGAAVLDALVITRPTFVYAPSGVAGPWPLSIATGAVTVIDGQVSGGDKASFREVAAELLLDAGTGSAHISVSGAGESGARVAGDRWLPFDTAAGETGVSLQAVFGALGDVYRTSSQKQPPSESALPGALLRP
jgi:Domain of Unknown Function (DUF748)